MDYNTTVAGKGAGKAVQLSDVVFACDFNEPLIHQVVTAHLAGARAGTKAQKNRSDVSGGGRKPWRQKGTGRARAGTIRSPIWRSGGVTFAARNRDFSQKVNRKSHRAAMRSIFSELVRQERLVIVDNFTFDKPKTKEAALMLTQLDCTDALVITADKDVNVSLSIRNLPNIHCIDADNINPVDLVAFKKVILTVDTIKKIEERLA